MEGFLFLGHGDMNGFGASRSEFGDMVSEYAFSA
jgi:hypothetical protein